MATLAVVAQAQYGPTFTSQNANTFRTFGNSGQVSTFSKTIDTPFSSVRKSDVRVSNPGYALGGYHGYAAPAVAVAHAPAYHGYAAPAYAAPAYAHGPAYAHAPVVAKAVVGGGLLGVAYSAAPVVSHMTYSNGLGFNYAW